MKELIDFKKIWDWMVLRWRNSFGSIVLAVLAFVIGMELQEKLIVDDCKFMGSFRDGIQTYNCTPRAR